MSVTYFRLVIRNCQLTYVPCTYEEWRELTRPRGDHHAR